MLSWINYSLLEIQDTRVLVSCFCDVVTWDQSCLGGPIIHVRTCSFTWGSGKRTYRVRQAILYSYMCERKVACMYCSSYCSSNDSKRMFDACVFQRHTSLSDIRHRMTIKEEVCSSTLASDSDSWFLILMPTPRSVRMYEYMI